MLKIIRKVFSFADWSATRPNTPHPGDMLDAQFDEIIDRVQVWEDRVSKAINNDGKIAYGAIDNTSVIPQIAEAVFHDASTRMQPGIYEVDRAAKLAREAADAADAALIRAGGLQAEAGLLASQLTPLQAAALEKLAVANARAAELTAIAEGLQDDWTQAQKDAFAADQNAMLWAEVSQDWAEHMPDTIPPNTLAWMGISGDHWSSRWWANQAANAFGAMTGLYFGALPEPPTTALDGGPIPIGGIYFDTDPPPGQMMVWNGSTWEPLWAPQRSVMATLTYTTADAQTTLDLSQPDVNGDSYTITPTQPEAVDVHLNGVRLVRTGTGAIGDYQLDPATSTITFVRPLRAGGVLGVDILMPEARMAGGQVQAWSLNPISTFNGVLTTFTLTAKNPAIAVNIQRSEELLVSLNDVLLEPGVDFNASGNQITFAAAPVAATPNFITWFQGMGVSGGGSVAWGDITGKPSTFPPAAHSHPTSQVTGLDAALAAKAPLASPIFTGNPQAPTPSPAADNDTSIATTAFVQAAIAAALAVLPTGEPGTPVGEVIFWPKTTPPANYLKANGAVISRTTYADLFNIIGTTFGAGDGTTTFALPDLRGEFLRGWDDARGVDAGRTFGSAQGPNIASHTHAASSDTVAAHTHTGTTSSDSHTHTGTTASGGSHSHTYTRTIESQGDTGGEGGTGMLSSTVNTSTAAAHTHTFTTSSDAHTHTFTTSAAGGHSHAITVSAFGTGTDTRPRNVALLACIKYQMG